MRKFCRFLSIFVLFSLLLTSACSKNNSFYFEILTNQIKVNLNQEICLTDLNCNTNLPDYELVDFYCENSLIAVVENNKVKAINIFQKSMQLDLFSINAISHGFGYIDGSTAAFC